MVRADRARKKRKHEKQILWQFSKKMLLLTILIAINIGTLYIFKIKDTPKDSNTPVNPTLIYPRYVYKIDKGQPWGSLTDPMQVLANKGRLYVSDTGNGRVLVFDLKGKYITEFEKGVAKEQRRLKFPYGLAADEKGDIYVADSQVGKVMIFNNQGDYLRDFNNDNKYITRPAGLFIRKERVYISDIGSHKVHVFNKDAKCLLSIGSGNNGNSNDDLYYPNAVTVDNNGKMYISDSMNNRVQIFSDQGKYKETIGGGDSLYMSNPRGIAIGEDGFIYIASTLGNSIKVLDKDALFLFEMHTDKGYTINYPVSVSIDQYDHLFIVNSGNNQVLAFKSS